MPAETCSTCGRRLPADPLERHECISDSQRVALDPPEGQDRIFDVPANPTTEDNP